MKNLNKQAFDDLVELCKDLASAYGVGDATITTLVIAVLDAVEHPTTCDDRTARSLHDWLVQGLSVKEWISWNSDSELVISLTYPELYRAWQTVNTKAAELRAVEAHMAASWKANQDSQ